MSNDKNSDNEMGKIIPLAAVGLVILAYIKIILVIIFTALLTSGASLAMAYREKILQRNGKGRPAIFWNKLKLGLMLIPFVAICAILAEYYVPTKIKINPLNSSESRELTTKERIVNAEAQIKRINKDSLKKTNEIQNELGEFQRLKNMSEENLDSYEKEMATEQFEEKRSELLKKNDQVTKNLASISKLQKKLQSLKNTLKTEKVQGALLEKSNLNLFNKATAYFSKRNEKGRVEDFIKIALGLLGAAFFFSFLLTSFIKEEDLEKGVGIPNVSKVFYGFFRAMSFISYLFIWPYFIYKKGMGKEIDPEFYHSHMQLGREYAAYLTDKNLNYHTQIIGGSGAGKTNLLKVMLEDRMAKGHSIIFFDFKADIELMDWMAGASEQYSRSDDLVILSMSDPKLSYAYNPIKHGSETEISSQIMNSLTWSEPFYKSKSEGALLVIFKALCYQRDIGGRDFHLGDLYQFLNDASFRMDVVSAVSSLNYPEMYRGDLKRICEELTVPNKKENFSSLITQISKILNSSAGEIVVHKIGNDAEFDFREVMETGKIAYLFMNSLKLKDTASIMGKLMLQDLMKAVGNIYDDRNAIKHPTTLIIDEFASFATPDFGEFIEKARGAGISIVIAYQSRKSLDHIEDNLAIKVNENTANKIVFQVQDSEDVEWFCSLLGTKKTTKETHQAENGLFGDIKTGMKSVREVEEYVIHPNQIKNLKLGQALLYCSKVDRHHVIMNIKKANEFDGRYERKSVANQNFKKIDTIKIDRTKEKEVEVNNYF